jgi:hypothetical protein
VFEEQKVTLVYVKVNPMKRLHRELFLWIVELVSRRTFGVSTLYFALVIVHYQE